MTAAEQIALWAACRETHEHVRRIFVPTDDAQQYPQSFDHWLSLDEARAAIVRGRLPDDCDGFARACQVRLLDLHGIKSHLLTCQVYVPEQKLWSGHLVCEAGGDAVTGKDGLVLCNLRDIALPRHKLADKYGYRFQLLGLDGVWHELVQHEGRRG